MLNPALLIDTFTPQTVARTADTTGGVTEVWSDGTAFKGRLSTLNVNETMSQDKGTVLATHKIYSNVQTIDAEARIRNSDSSRYFEIKGVVKPSNRNDGHLEILVRELD